MAGRVDAGGATATRVVRYHIRELHHAEEIRPRLEEQRAYAAYAIGQLGPRLFNLVRCWEAQGPDGDALALFSRGGLGDALFLSGEPGALAALLTIHQGPRTNFATCREAHLPVVERFYRVTSGKPMLRMAVDAAAFLPAPAPDLPAVHTRRVTGRDAREVNRLYNSEGQPTYYSQGHIDQGMYHGVFEGRRLVAVAGTHVISPEEGVAVVGNVFTDPERRGLGYGTLATSATTAALLRRCRDVALTVDPLNTPAVRAYVRLGYREESRLVESQITRRTLFGFRPFLAARLASWRGRGNGDDCEVVIRH